MIFFTESGNGKTEKGIGTKLRLSNLDISRPKTDHSNSSYLYLINARIFIYSLNIDLC